MSHVHSIHFVSPFMLVSRLSSVGLRVVSMVTGGWGDYLYRFVLCFMLVSFLSLRMPYIFGMGGFAVYLFFIISPLFLSLLLGRLIDMGPASFFSSFVPQGTPLWIAPLVCLAETLSYLVRPVVLMIRPFVNLTMGVLGGYALGTFSLGMWWVGLFLVALFFFEVFVAVVHWFIVCSILSFSEDH